MTEDSGELVRLVEDGEENAQRPGQGTEGHDSPKGQRASFTGPGEGGVNLHLISRRRDMRPCAGCVIPFEGCLPSAKRILAPGVT